MKAHPELVKMPKNNATKQWLCEAAVEAWEGIKDRILYSLVKSMKKRLEAVIAANG